MRTRSVVTAAVLASMAACGRAPTPAAPAASSAARADPDFRAPPTLVAAARDAAGAVTLTGHAQPDARIALRSPSGESFAAVAGADGGWTLRLPAMAEPRAFAVSASRGARTVRAEGALLVAPAPFVAATLLRAGAPALPVGVGDGGLRWTSLDDDPGGGAAVSGFAPPGAALRLAIDGVVRGEGSADASGRFGVLWLGGAVPPGAHAVTVSTPSRTRTLDIGFGPASLGGAPVRIAAERQGWRIDWAPPGGGVQTLHLLAPSTSLEAAP